MFNRKNNKLEERVAELEKKVELIGIAESKLLQDFEELKNKVSPKKIEEKKFISTITGFETDEDFQKFTNIITDIAQKDETVKFDINSNDREVFIYSTDKNSVHRKSLWLVTKTGIEGLKYNVR